MADEKNGKNRGRGRLWPLFVGLPLIAIIALAAVVLAGGGNRAPQTGGQERQPADGAEQASGGGGGTASGAERLGHPALGEAGAPVVMVEYGDFQ